eukprot:PhM_4_TR1921/c0_g1_i1/m.87905
MSTSTPANIFIAGLPTTKQQNINNNNDNNNNNNNSQQPSAPSFFDESDLRTLFAPYGNILNCKVMVDVDTGIPKGFGFVRFATLSEASRAIQEMNGTKTNTDRTLYVTLANHDGSPSVVESERIYIRNLPKHVTEANLHTVFTKYGEVLECKVLRDTNSGQSKGVAFVRFRTVDEARRAVQEAQGTRPFDDGPNGCDANNNYDSDSSSSTGSFASSSAASSSSSPSSSSSRNRPLMVRFAETHDARISRQSRHGNGGGNGSGSEKSTPRSNHQDSAATAAVPVAPSLSQQQPQPQPQQTLQEVVLATYVMQDPATGLKFTTTVSATAATAVTPQIDPAYVQQHMATISQVFQQQQQQQPQQQQ